MKRIAVVTLVAAVFAVAAIALADGMGAVKRDLLVTAPVNTGEVIGWVIANSTGTDEIQVETHVQNGRPNTEFQVQLRNALIGGGVYPDIVVETDLGPLVTNEDGIGNFHAVTTIIEPEGYEWVDMKVWLRAPIPNPDPPPANLTLRYAARFHPDTILVPIKP